MDNGDPRFMALLDEMRILHCRKGNDYGKKTDYLSNLRASERFGVPAWIGSLIRLNDKMVRLENVATGVELTNESAEDSLIDMACYSLLTLILYREHLESGVDDHG